MLPRSLYLSIGGDRKSAISESWTDFDAVKSIWIDSITIMALEKPSIR